jgi:hypothetical protein
MGFDVDPDDGHDDSVMSLALVSDAAARVRQLTVQGRRGEGWEEAPRRLERGQRARTLE